MVSIADAVVYTQNSVGNVMGNHNHQPLTVKQLFRAFKQLKQKDTKFPINAALALLYVAEHEPCLKQDMEIALDFTSASGSRNTDYLSNNNRLRKPGLGFISKEDNPDDRRHSILTLTPRGKDFINSLGGTNADLEGGC